MLPEFLAELLARATRAAAESGRRVYYGTLGDLNGAQAAATSTYVDRLLEQLLP
jgi:hypothetical protein